MDNLRAIALMCVAMACFAIEDMVIKIVARDLPTWQIFVLMGGVGLVMFASLCRRHGLPLISRAFLHPLVLVRNTGEIIAALGFVTALTLVELSLATAILQGTPLAVTAAAALVLGEQVGWRRWVAVGLGMVGILIILDPFGADFRPEALLALLGVLGLVLRDIATRRIPQTIPTPQLTFWGVSSYVLCGVILFPFQPGVVVPAPATWAVLVGGAVMGASGYWALTTATRLGEVSAVVPFRYTRLIFAMALGVLVLGERPAATTLLGAALVVGTGLYTVLRERRLARAAAAPAC